jgi:hypothetical protein
MAKEASHITDARRELIKFQRNARFFSTEYRKYRARGSDLAQPYRLMRKNALAHVRQLEQYIRKSVAIQKRIDELTLRIAALEASAHR